MALLDRIQIGSGGATSEDINRLQANVERAVSAVSKARPRVTVTFAVANVDTRIFHTLGRPLVGATLVRATAAMSIYDGSPSTDPTKFANLKASAVGTGTFEVF